MTEADIIQECERAFQAGGPRVYLVESVYGGGFHIRPSGNGPRNAVKHAFPGQQVWARIRRNGRTRFEWVHMNGPKKPTDRKRLIDTLWRIAASDRNNGQYATLVFAEVRDALEVVGEDVSSLYKR